MLRLGSCKGRTSATGEYIGRASEESMMLFGHQLLRIHTDAPLRVWTPNDDMLHIWQVCRLEVDRPFPISVSHTFLHSPLASLAFDALLTLSRVATHSDLGCTRGSRVRLLSYVRS